MRKQLNDALDAAMKHGDIIMAQHIARAIARMDYLRMCEKMARVSRPSYP